MPDFIVLYFPIWNLSRKMPCNSRVMFIFATPYERKDIHRIGCRRERNTHG